MKHGLECFQGIKQPLVTRLKVTYEPEAVLRRECHVVNTFSRFIAIEQLRYGNEDSMQAVISNRQVLILGSHGVASQDANIILQVPYEHLYSCSSSQNQRELLYRLLFVFGSLGNMSQKTPQAWHGLLLQIVNIS